MKTKNNSFKILFLTLFLALLAIFVLENKPLLPLTLNSAQNNGPVKVVTEESATISSVKKIGPSVVTIVGSPGKQNSFGLGPLFFGSPQNTQPSGQSIGSGFIFSSTGLIVTNKHVVSDPTMTYQVITANDKKYNVTNIYRDPNNDIAVVKVNTSQNPGNNLIPAVMGNSSNLQAGEFVVAIGTALGQFRNTVTTGVISGLGRGITAGSLASNGSTENLSNLIQTSAAVNPGNSGGPLVNADQQVIGMNTAIAANGQDIGFALPINTVKNFINSLGFNP